MPGSLDLPKINRKIVRLAVIFFHLRDNWNRTAEMVYFLSYFR